MARLDSLALWCRDSDKVGSMYDMADFLSSQAGIKGDMETYYDPENSRIDRVLTRFRGNPITLSVIWMAVGRRVGVDLVGIGMPGHFLVRDRWDEDSFYDTYYGVPLERMGVQRLFEDRNGKAQAFAAEYIDPVTDMDTARRMLANLTSIYVHQADSKSLAWVLKLRTLMPGVDPSTHRQLAGVLGHLGRYWEAADVYEQLVELQPARAEQHQHAVRRLRAHGN